ncbi:DUF998 domain-containing protein [Pontibacter liquoris]|uniref:DUF998 domain-containing protein n=1 Tax=Pontibacter liquoris TaxID=2905677 RepID=UPI001FA75BC6|nr:DUF998 domain-containing protein [Pontibacter liquoris]
MPNLNFSQRRKLIRVGAVSCYVACIGDFLVTILLAMLSPGYDSLEQPESFLSVSGSPVAPWFAAWSVAFSGLLILSSLGIMAAFRQRHSASITVLASLITLYGIGEGIISGVFPFDIVNGRLSVSAQIHEVASIVGQIGLYLVPVAGWYALRREYPLIKGLSILVIVSGSIFVLLYNASKLHLVSYRGLWQRLFMATYFLYLMYLALLADRRARDLPSPNRA